ncbi:MAG: Epidermal growth factor receptor [Candidatus Peregrinibacteria bacterium GW2011_GWF2_43_17]|nr:MAG: Epidermal growth factor receptor [Candidatus Peregrinibacteria bacterium GW2011_GWF2_43_17]
MIISDTGVPLLVHMPNITQTCRITGREFTVTEWEQEHLKKFGVPLPTLCADERLRRRLAHRNERKLYKRNCDLAGKPIISIYSPDKPFKVYSQEAWWGDKWDAKDYGREYDFSRPFFEQFTDLQKEVPVLCLMNKNGVNSDYCNITHGNKNCYLVFGGDFNEDCMYSIFSMHSRNMADVYWVNKSELVYDSINCIHCYSIKYCEDCQNCSNSSFLFACRNCQNCFACVGLVAKQYCIWNKQYSREEYEKTIKQFKSDTWSGVKYTKEIFAKFKLNFPHKYANLVSCENCTGDQVSNVKNCTDCFYVEGPAEDCKDVFIGGYNAKDIMSSDHIGFDAELFYEMLGSIRGNHNALCRFSWCSNNTYYCSVVDSCKDLFGCVSMKRAEYCILNKQYTKSEYEEIVPRIINHMKSTCEWGEYFPIETSQFAYNETVANDFFPMTREEALKKGCKWLDEKNEPPKKLDVPDSIHDTKDDILAANLLCEKTGRPYKIIKPELDLYRKMEIPVPHYAPETRNEIRIARLNPLKTFDRTCAKCGASLKTAYKPENPATIYCEKCYLGILY